MNIQDYCKNRLFGLIYWHSSYGSSLKSVHNFYENDKGKSLVLSARTGNLMFDNLSYINNKINIDPFQGKAGRISSQSDRLDIFFWLTASPISDVKRLLREYRSENNVIREIFKTYSEECNNFKSALFLCDFTNEDPCELNKIFEYYYPIECFKVIAGGVEVIYTYLLSDFIKENERQFTSTQQRLNDDTLHDTLLPEYPYSTDASDDYISPIYDFNNNSNLDHLSETIEDKYEDEYDQIWTRKGGAYPYYNLDIKALKGVKKDYYIPDRVKEILTQDQVDYLRMTSANVLENHLEHIIKDVLNIRFGDLPFSPMHPTNESSKAWNQDMYSMLGGDGCNSAYLGDGVSIDRYGIIAED